MQGVYINYERPKSKKAVKEAAAADPTSVQIEATSMFDNEYNGTLADMPDGSVHFVGPDPYTSRKFYGTITKTGDKIKVA